MASEPRYPAFARYAWIVFAYTLLVILYGAWVRITGSGAGCGDHWPSCHGELVPRTPTAQTVIEFTHRVTSGVLGPMVIALTIWAWVGAGKRRALGVLASLVLFFVVVEALIGRSLVVQELVGENASVKRAVVVGLHLGNTLILMWLATATAWLGAGGGWPKLGRRFAGRGWVTGALLGTAIVSMMGAVTALGDTLFPVKPTLGAGVLSRLGADLSEDAHFLVRLRIIHPLLASALAIVLLWLSQRYGELSRKLGRLSTALAACTWAQLGVGIGNIALGAPGWVQLVHLLLAQVLWALLVVMLLELARIGQASAVTFSAQPARAASEPQAEPSRAEPQLLGPAEEPEPDLEESGQPRVLPIEDSIDLHAFAPRDILDVVDSYLEAAQEKGYVEVRLIHGRGTGYQRARVQELLRTHPLVERFADAPPTRGGWGATLAWLKPRTEAVASERHG